MTTHMEPGEFNYTVRAGDFDTEYEVTQVIDAALRAAGYCQPILDAMEERRRPRLGVVTASGEVRQHERRAR